MLRLFRKKRDTIAIEILKYLYPHFGSGESPPINNLLASFKKPDEVIKNVINGLSESKYVRFNSDAFRLCNIKHGTELHTLKNTNIIADITQQGKDFYESHVRQRKIISNANWQKIAVAISVASLASNVIFGILTVKNSMEIKRLKDINQTQSSTIESLNKAASFREKDR